MEELRGLELPADSFIVVGSGLLEVLGIRPAGDIDVIVAQSVLGLLETPPWQVEERAGGKQVLSRGRFEVSTSWSTPTGEAGLAELRTDRLVVAGFQFISMARLLAWKTGMRRAKDLDDIKLIESHLAGRPVQRLGPPTTE
ncbi:hypothetical protein DPM19_08530 [Actinomadura craniellae]|uniref:Uncharacterized protein n=1 Tax=Actinomadura craniellae TaxID=2231787 RepID=A0A365HA44_9ACTN|nr:hypothetical protein DPM19_08530 [Actinomadura craniellae]